MKSDRTIGSLAFKTVGTDGAISKTVVKVLEDGVCCINQLHLMPIKEFEKAMQTPKVFPGVEICRKFGKVLVCVLIAFKWSSLNTIHYNAGKLITEQLQAGKLTPKDIL